MSRRRGFKCQFERGDLSFFAAIFESIDVLILLGTCIQEFYSCTLISNAGGTDDDF